MNNAKHTPGPWAVHGGRHGVYRVVDTNGNTVRTFHDGWGCRGNLGLANALMMAASPRMLEALVMALDDSDVTGPDGKPVGLRPETLAAIRAAVAQAEGGLTP